MWESKISEPAEIRIDREFLHPIIDRKVQQGRSESCSEHEEGKGLK